MNIKKRLFVSLLSLIMIFIMMFLSLIIYFNPSFGWFVKNIDAKSSGQQVHIDNDEITADYNVYTYDAITNTLMIDTDLNVDLVQFDTIFRARNKYTPAIIEITLDFSNMQQQGSTVNIDLDCDTSIQDKISDKIQFMLVKNSQYNSIISATNKNLVTNNTELAIIFSDIYDYSLTVTKISFQQNAAHLQISYSNSDVVNNLLKLYIFVVYNEQQINTDVNLNNISSTIGQIDYLVNNITDMIITVE